MSQPKPTLWQRWGPTTLTLGLPALLFIGYLLVDYRIDTKVGPITDKIDNKLQKVNDKLDNVGQKFATIEGELKALTIQKLAMQPKDATNAKQTSEILNKAKKDGAKLDPQVITNAGKQFIAAADSSSDPLVWNAALAFLDFRSFLNTGFAPPTDEFVEVDKKKRYEWQAIFPMNLQKSQFLFAHGKAAPAEKAAVFEPIGRPLNIGKSVGSEFILLAGSTGLPEGWKLDGYRLKNVIFKDSEITYEGGPIDLQNVYFVNCTFNVSKQPNGKHFANTVLASAPATTFQAGG